MLKPLLLILSLFLLVNCSIKKRFFEVIEKEDNTLKTTEKDSETKVTTSEAIDESFFIGLKTNNPSVDSLINLKLANFYSYKKSGKNLVKTVYDAEKGGFVVSTVLGASVDSVSTKKTSNVSNATVTTNQVKTIDTTKTNYKYMIYFYLLIVAIVAVLFLVIKNKLGL